MTGMLKTYTKEDLKPKKEEKNKNHIDSYNPATSSRELNPYWKDGGTGIPQTAENFRKSRQFIRPTEDDDDFYSRSSSSKGYESGRTSYEQVSKRPSGHEYARDKSDHDSHRSYNWKKQSENKINTTPSTDCSSIEEIHKQIIISEPKETKMEEKPKSLYMSDEKLNKLAAKVVKAEIMGDTKLMNELKAKLEIAREYRKQHPHEKEQFEDNEGIMLISTNSSGNSAPLVNTAKGDARSKGGKRKAETHTSGERTKYFGNDDKYNLAQMVRFIQPIAANILIKYFVNYY